VADKIKIVSSRNAIILRFEVIMVVKTEFMVFWEAA